MGKKTKGFSPSRGLRQGGPFSRYIFVLCIERLNHIIKKAMANGSWKLIFVTKNGPLLSSLFFTDDLILFGEASMAQASVIKGYLDRFCKASGQKVSFNESVVHFSKNVMTQLREDISNHLGIVTTEDLRRYLGMPAIHGRVTRTNISACVGQD